MMKAEREFGNDYRLRMDCQLRKSVGSLIYVFQNVVATSDGLFYIFTALEGNGD